MERTIAIAGANSRIARDLIPLLKQDGCHIIGLTRKQDDSGQADEKIADWMNSPRTRGAIRAADALITLTGDLFTDDASIHTATVTTTERILTGLDDQSRCKRLIALSYIGADSKSGNAYLRANGQREQLLINTGIPTTIFRCPAILNTPVDPDGTAEAYTAKDGVVRLLGDGTTRQRPIYRADVVQAIRNALESTQSGVYDLVGPDSMSADQLIRLINLNKPINIQHTPAWLARLIGRFIPGLTATTVDIILMPILANPDRAAKTFNLNLTPLSTIWRS